jgi:hypothetical protein
VKRVTFGYPDKRQEASLNDSVLIYGLTGIA